MKLKEIIGKGAINTRGIKIKVSICIPVFNNFNLTKDCLKDLSFLPYDCEVMVFDNGSTDETINLEKLPKSQLPQNFKYIRNENNLGFAKSSNLLFKNSTGEFIIFLNNDIRVKKNHSNWVNELIEKAEDNSLVGPTIGKLDLLFNFISEYTSENFNDKLSDINKIKEKLGDGIYYLSGWCLCGKKEVFNKLIIDNYDGPFTEEFFTYFEDSDLSIRAEKQNINLKCFKVPLQHFGRMTSKKIGLSSLYSSAKEKFKQKWLNKI